MAELLQLLSPSVFKNKNPHKSYTNNINDYPHVHGSKFRLMRREVAIGNGAGDHPMINLARKITTKNETGKTLTLFLLFFRNIIRNFDPDKCFMYGKR